MVPYFGLVAIGLLGSLIPQTAEGHGSMVKPYSWIDTGGNIGMESFMSCNAGFDVPVAPDFRMGAACLWFNNFTLIPGEPTLDPAMLTHPQFVQWGMMEKNPWMSPGSAPLFSPCGVAGGNPNGCPPGSSQEFGEYCPNAGWAYGPLAEEYYISPGFPDVVTTEWKAGSVVEAAWAIIANHGGGYSYRLCKVPLAGVGGVTEECFQQIPLEFSGDVQWAQYGEDVSSRIQFKAHRTKQGTTPEGSQWTRNPIPNCISSFPDNPGPYDPPDYGLYDANCSLGTQYPPPAPGLFGYGYPAPSYQPKFGFSIVDELVVPDITPGEYVLSFRWDAEQTFQVWSQCANIKIV